MPLPEGDRVVSLVNWDASTSNRERRLLRDFDSVARDDVARRHGISRTVERNLIVDGSQSRIR